MYSELRWEEMFMVNDFLQKYLFINNNMLTIKSVKYIYCTCHDYEYTLEHLTNIRKCFKKIKIVLGYILDNFIH